MSAQNEAILLQTSSRSTDAAIKKDSENLVTSGAVYNATAHKIETTLLASGWTGGTAPFVYTITGLVGLNDTDKLTEFSINRAKISDVNNEVAERCCIDYLECNAEGTSLTLQAQIKPTIDIPLLIIQTPTTAF